MNMLPIRVRTGEGSVEESISRTHRLLTQLLRHEHAPLALAQRCSAVAAPTPLFSAFLNYRHSGANNGGGSGAGKAAPAWEGIEMLDSEDRTNYPLGLNVDDRSEWFSLSAQAQPPVEPDRICAYMHTALERLVEALEKSPATPLRNLNVMP